MNFIKLSIKAIVIKDAFHKIKTPILTVTLPFGNFLPKGPKTDFAVLNKPISKKCSQGVPLQFNSASFGHARKNRK